MDTSGMYKLFTDGGARGNPGPAGLGAVLYDPEGNLLAEKKDFLTEATNNLAEYKALQMGLKLALDHKVEELLVHMDSELIVMQVNGAYHVKNKRLREEYLQVKELRDNFKKIIFVHVRREKNKEADRLANEAMDAAKTTE